MSQATSPQGSVAAQDFWTLLYSSQLIPPQQLQHFQQQFYQMKGAENASAGTIAEWLISQNCISRFQAKVLLSGQTGPFQFGDYKVFDRFENGRLAGVFSAVHAQTNHPVHLMFLAGPYAQDAARLVDAAKQAGVLSGIKNNNIVRCYHFADLQAYRFVAFEYLQGQTLRDMISSQGALSPSEACRIARQVAIGLMGLQEAKVVHGELRPENVWVNQLGTAKIMGFPLHRDPLVPVQLFDPNTAASNPRKVDFLAPEIARGGIRPDIRSDLYSLGCLLYECLTGQVPFPDDNVFQKVLKHASEAVPPPNQINGNVPTAVSQLVMYLLAKDPNQRYQQPAHVAEALVPYIDPNGLTIYADPPSQPGQAYEAWLAQAHPPAEPDPDTGEFNFGIQVEDFSHVKVDEPAPVPNFPSFGQQNQPVQQPAGFPQPGPGAGGFPQVGSGAGSLPQPGGFPGVGGAPSGVGTAPSGAGGFPQGQQPISTHETAAEIERRKEEAFNRKLTQWAVGVGSTAVILILALVVYNNFVAPEQPKDTVAATNGEDAKDAKEQPDPLTGDVGPTKTKTVTKTSVQERPKTGGPTTNPKSSGNEDDGQQSSVSGDLLEEIYADRGPPHPSPTSGEPLDLKYLAFGPQMFIHMRPADLLADPEGKRVWEALGPFGVRAQQFLEAKSGTTLENIESVLVGLIDNGAEPPKVTAVIRTLAPVPESQLLAAWGNPAGTMVEGRKVYQDAKLAYFTPPAGAGRIIALGPKEAAKDLLGSEVYIPRREIEEVMRQSDSMRHVNVLFAPHFPFSGGKIMFNKSVAANLPWAKDEADNLARIQGIEFAKAALLSAHVGPDGFFTEIRYHGGSGYQGMVIGKELYGKLLQLPQQLVTFYTPPPAESEEKRQIFIPSLHVQPLIARFPKMLQAWTAYLRLGADGKQAVITGLLPKKAAHNLVLASQLAIRDPGTVVDTGPKVEDPTKWALMKKLSELEVKLVFAQNSLNRVVRELGQEYGFTVELNGGDLEMKGITQNQSFGMNVTEPTPLGKIFEQICFKANIDKTTKSIDEDKQILVFVTDAASNKVIITTRDKAHMRGDPWPGFKIAKP